MLLEAKPRKHTLLMFLRQSRGNIYSSAFLYSVHIYNGLATILCYILTRFFLELSEIINFIHQYAIMSPTLTNYSNEQLY